MSVDHLFISQPYGDMLQAEFFGSAAELRGDDPASILQIANSKPESLSDYLALANPDKSTSCEDLCAGVPGVAARACVAKCYQTRGETPPPPAGISLLPGWLVNPDAKKWLIVGIGAILILIGINAALR
ncbi:MAG TPA: hypothetical protein VK667_04945 [Ktedonobacteraceae bacterium]|nr:hypothetical protein [Ktedonobacteraceae bacterium]